MKQLFTKSFLLLFITLHLCSCIMYQQQEKYETTYSIEKTLSQLNQSNPQHAFFKQNINFNHYTENNIKKLFGTPNEILKNGNETILSYQHRDFQPVNTIAPLFPIIKYDNGDNIYHYAFILSEGKLTAIKMDAVKIDTKAVGLLIPPYIHLTSTAYIDPFTIKQSCHNELNNIDYTVPHHSNSHIQTNYSHNKLFDSSLLKDNIFDASQREKGFTRSTIISLFRFNPQIFHTSKKDYEKYMKESFTLTDSQRLTDITPIKETNYTNKNTSCKIYSKTGKDAYATNRGQYPYLILDIASAFCTFPNKNIIMIIENSNRFPISMVDEVHTYQELINTLKTIKYNTPRSFNPAHPILNIN